MLSASEVSRRSILIAAQIEGLLVLLPKRTRFPAELKGIEEDAVRAIVALAERHTSEGCHGSERQIAGHCGADE